MIKEYNPSNFFDTFSQFYTTSNTSPFPDRLNNRFLALIEANRDIIKNSTVLDLGSHDGRWSFAAIKVGAKRVIGIEPRGELIKNAQKNMNAYNISKNKFEFIQGDAFEKISTISVKIDVVFCFGFFYHILNHLLLLSKIKALDPKYLILDTSVDPSEESIIKLHEEDALNESMGINYFQFNDNKTLVGIPSKKAVELMLSKFGFDYKYYDWHLAGIKDWKNLWDYKTNKRISIVAKNVIL